MIAIALLRALEASQDKIRTYVENNLTTELLDNNQTSTTLIDIIGGSKIIKSNRHTLPYFLENSVVVEGNKYDKLPNDLKQYIT